MGLNTVAARGLQPSSGSQQAEESMQPPRGTGLPKPAAHVAEEVKGQEELPDMSLEKQ